MRFIGTRKSNPCPSASTRFLYQRTFAHLSRSFTAPAEKHNPQTKTICYIYAAITRYAIIAPVSPSPLHSCSIVMSFRNRESINSPRAARKHFSLPSANSNETTSALSLGLSKFSDFSASIMIPYLTERIRQSELMPLNFRNTCLAVIDFISFRARCLLLHWIRHSRCFTSNILSGGNLVGMRIDLPSYASKYLLCISLVQNSLMDFESTIL